MFITIEGGEGSGKSTLIKKLQKEIVALGKEVVVTREPGGTKFGDHIRNCLLNPNFDISFGYRAELLLFLTSRVEHIEKVIDPALKSGKCVICDRFNDSTIAYQGGARGLGIDYAIEICNLACLGLQPDITFFLDIDPESGLERIKGGLDRLEKEKLSFHQKVRKAFYELQKRFPERIHIIDANKTIDEVFKEACNIVKKCF